MERQVASMIRAALVVAASSVVLFAQDPQQPVFRSGTRTVPVYVTVTDKTGRLVTERRRGHRAPVRRSPSRLSGVLRDPSGSPRHATAYVFPADRALWQAGVWEPTGAFPFIPDRYGRYESIGTGATGLLRDWTRPS